LHKILPVIISGGGGQRLWPASSPLNPKPFMRVFGNDPIIASSFRVASLLAGEEGVLVVTSQEQFERTEAEVSKIGPVCKNIYYILEPMGRDTAAAMTMAAFWAQTNVGPHTVLVILPADHMIKDQAAAASALSEAVDIASRGGIVSLGIKPLDPNTGFGYIEAGDELPDGGMRVLSFTEKPSKERATQYLASGKYFWNSGVYCFSAEAFLGDMARYNQEVYARAKACWDLNKSSEDKSKNIIKLDEGTFSAIPKISVDYALMEKTTNITVLPVAFDWYDVGSWDSIAQLFDKDLEGNSCVGDVSLLNVRNTLVFGSDQKIGVVGIRDSIVVQTDEGLLVAAKGSTEMVKQLEIRHGSDIARGKNSAEFIAKPWGGFANIEGGEGYKVKRLQIDSNQSISLQKHEYRSEHWVIVRGKVKVICSNESKSLSVGDSFFVPLGAVHRLVNESNEPCEVIEVQIGDILSEEDIVRFEDQYGRCL
jgi:mannose-1-phosphate guanylyltransferase/mannose-6-phosphate isomerase